MLNKSISPNWQVKRHIIFQYNQRKVPGRTLKTIFVSFQQPLSMMLCPPPNLLFLLHHPPIFPLIMQDWELCLLVMTQETDLSKLYSSDFPFERF